jgi:hypothetical protein
MNSKSSDGFKINQWRISQLASPISSMCGRRAGVSVMYTSYNTLTIYLFKGIQNHGFYEVTQTFGVLRFFFAVLCMEALLKKAATVFFVTVSTV